MRTTLSFLAVLVSVLGFAVGVSSAADAPAARVRSDSSATERGEQIFRSTCAACHGLDGRGGEHAPNIATEPRVQGMDDDALAKVITNGIPAAGMPGFGSSLKPEQIRSVVTYLRTL